MLNLQTRHWMLLAGLMAAIGVQLAGLKTWAEAASPLFVGGLFGQVAVVITSIFTERPRDPEALTRSSDPGVPPTAGR